MASNPEHKPQATHRPPAHHRRRIRVSYFSHKSCHSSAIQYHPTLAEPSLASHQIGRFLGRAPTEPAKPAAFLNHVLGSASRNWPLRLLSPAGAGLQSTCGPEALPGVCPSKGLQGGPRESRQDSQKPLKANAFKCLPRSLWVLTSPSALQFLKSRGGPFFSPYPHR